MKKPIALLLALGMLLSAVPFVSAAGKPEEAAEAAEEPAAALPACAETGVHEVASWTFAENGTHAGVCSLCGEPVPAVSCVGSCVSGSPNAQGEIRSPPHTVQTSAWVPSSLEIYAAGSA